MLHYLPKNNKPYFQQLNLTNGNKYLCSCKIKYLQLVDCHVTINVRTQSLMIATWSLYPVVVVSPAYPPVRPSYIMWSSSSSTHCTIGIIRISIFMLHKMK
uniref:Uncharacterized protein n=1 Tax=Cacopsylla melanoneura TaxID=428564 RepID=A0A8D9DNW7_9HEMI